MAKSKAALALYAVTLCAQNAVRVFTQPPAKLSADLRSFDGEVVHVSQIAYADSDNTFIVTGPATFTLKATNVTVKGDVILLVLEDGTKATFNRNNPALTINISAESDEAEVAEEEAEEEDEAPKRGRGKKAVAVEEDEVEEDLEEELDDDSEADDEEDEDEAPAPRGRGRGRKAVAVEEDEDEDDEDDEEEDRDENPNQ